MDEPRDSATFRMAVGGLGLGLAIALAGICVILAFGSGEGEDQHWIKVTSHGFDAKRKPGSSRPRARSNARLSVGSHKLSGAPEIPGALWAIAAALAGALLGLLLPSPLLKREEDREEEVRWRTRDTPVMVFAVALALGVFFVGLFTDVSASRELQSLVAAGGACLVGIMIPTPARFDLE